MTKRQPYNNYELWIQFKSGDRLAFQLIYRIHHKILISYGNKISQDAELVRDAVQDLFLNLWVRRQNLADTDNIEPYLKTSLRHDLVRKINESRTGVPFDGFSENDHLVERFYSLHTNDSEETEETFVRLEKALTKLPTRVSQALIMRYFDKMGNQEIAERMDINYQSVNNNIHRGVETLRVVMSR